MSGKIIAKDKSTLTEGEMTLKQTLIRKIQLARIISDLLMIVSNIFNNFTHTFQSSKFQSSISSFRFQKMKENVDVVNL